MHRSVPLLFVASTAEQVADLFDLIADADIGLGDLFDRIAGSRAPIHPATIRELEHLLEDTLRPAVHARSVLAGTPPQSLHAGLLCRRQRTGCRPAVAR